MYQTPQNAKGAKLEVKKSSLQPGMRGYKCEKMPFVEPTQHELVDADPGKMDEGAFIFKKK
jgi:hypothetical protein